MVYKVNSLFEKTSRNNSVELVGTIVGEPKYNHEVLGEKFYKGYIGVCRKSNYVDNIPFIVSSRLVDVGTLKIGMCIRVYGEYHSYNRKVLECEKSKLDLFVFCSEIDEVKNTHEINDILLNGYICKEPIYRETPLGRQVCDLLIAINGTYGKSQYIPCICWGRNALYSSSLKVGTKIKLKGRIQSREYNKKLDEEMNEKRIAYEVSVCSIYDVKQDIQELNENRGGH